MLEVQLEAILLKSFINICSASNIELLINQFCIKVGSEEYIIEISRPVLLY